MLVQAISAFEEFETVTFISLTNVKCEDKIVSL